MRTRVIHICILSLVMLVVVACGDFLEERSQNMAYVEEVKDLDELLIGEGYLKGGYSLDSADADKLANWASFTKSSQYYPYIHLMDDVRKSNSLGREKLYPLVCCSIIWVASRSFFGF